MAEIDDLIRQLLTPQTTDLVGLAREVRGTPVQDYLAQREIERARAADVEAARPRYGLPIRGGIYGAQFDQPLTNEQITNIGNLTRNLTGKQVEGALAGFTGGGDDLTRALSKLMPTAPTTALPAGTVPPSTAFGASADYGTPIAAPTLPRRGTYAYAGLPAPTGRRYGTVGVTGATPALDPERLQRLLNASQRRLNTLY
jgi:hypothetical protein